jgi:chromosome segregation ATPase
MDVNAQNEELQQQLDAANASLEEKTVLLTELTAQKEALQQQLNEVNLSVEDVQSRLTEANALLDEKTNLATLQAGQIAELITQKEQLQQTILSTTTEALQKRLTDTIASLEENVNLLNLKNLRIEHLTNVIMQKEIYCNELIKKQEQIISLNYTLLTRQNTVPEAAP